MSVLKYTIISMFLIIVLLYSQKFDLFYDYKNNLKIIYIYNHRIKLTHFVISILSIFMYYIFYSLND
jgi:hypothetical protein